MQSDTVSASLALPKLPECDLSVKRPARKPKTLFSGEPCEESRLIPGRSQLAGTQSVPHPVNGAMRPAGEERKCCAAADVAAVQQPVRRVAVA